MKAEDRIRIQHMIDAAEEALTFIHNIEFKEFSKNRLIILAVIKDIEILGEAASKITDETKNTITQIPWRDIIGMRNRLIYGYFDVNIKLVWNTVKNNLPPLLQILKDYLKKL